MYCAMCWKQRKKKLSTFGLAHIEFLLLLLIVPPKKQIIDLICVLPTGVGWGRREIKQGKDHWQSCHSWEVVLEVYTRTFLYKVQTQEWECNSLVFCRGACSFPPPPLSLCFSSFSVRRFSTFLHFYFRASVRPPRGARVRRSRIIISISVRKKKKKLFLLYGPFFLEKRHFLLPIDRLWHKRMQA